MGWSWWRTRWSICASSAGPKTCNQLSGTHQSARPANNVRTVDEALEEISDRHIILSITKEVMRGARNSLFDVKYTLLPTMEFINEVKKANSRALQLLKQRGFLLPEKGIGEAMG
jgi:hypothetical protein